MVKVLVFAGSLRKGSFNKKLASLAAELIRERGGDVTLIDLKDYVAPIYDADLETSEGMPQKAKQLRDLMIASEVVVISTPEYNASMPAALKNAIDWASRGLDGKPSREAFKGKQYAIMGASPGKLGASRSLVHLRQVLESAGATILEEQVAVPLVETAFDQSGKLVNPELNAALHKEIDMIRLTK